MLLHVLTSDEFRSQQNETKRSRVFIALRIEAERSLWQIALCYLYQPKTTFDCIKVYLHVVISLHGKRLNK